MGGEGIERVQSQFLICRTGGWGTFEPHCRIWGSMLSCVGFILGHVVQCWASVGKCWDHIGLTLSHFGASWHEIGLMLSHFKGSCWHFSWTWAFHR